jgi:S-adenosylmethionine hydrolase
VSGVITLLTDFGLDDVYVAIMKGVLSVDAPGVPVIDCCHEVPPQDVIGGGRRWRQAWPWFPPGSVHLAVVDPGVGTSRRILAARCAGHVFVCPDNGLLDLALRGRQPEVVVVVDRPDWYRQPVSQTFHGRDIMTPVVARLACGVAVEDCGAAIPGWQSSNSDRPVLDGSGDWSVPIVDFDHYGNALTELPGSALPPSATFEIAGHELGPLHHTYGAVPSGHLLVLLGSDGLVEVACNQGSAQERLGLARGQMLRVISRRG